MAQAGFSDYQQRKHMAWDSNLEVSIAVPRQKTDTKARGERWTTGARFKGGLMQVATQLAGP